MLKVMVDGLDSTVSYVTIKVMSDLNAVATPMVALGEHHTVALKSDGTVWTWGDNSYGQLGRSDYAAMNMVTFPGLDTANGESIAYVAASANTSYAITNQGKAYAWGDNTQYRLGANSSENFVAVPVLMVDNTGAAITNATDLTVTDTWTAEGYRSDVFVLTQDDAYVSHIYASGSTYSAALPVVLNGADSVVSVSGNYALHSDGSVWKISHNSANVRVLGFKEHPTDPET